jgi:hypothetical protein
MIWKYLVVAAYEGKALWACRITNGLSINSDANILIAIQDSVQIWQDISLGILQPDA